MQTADSFVLVYIPPRCRTAAYEGYATFADAAREYRAIKADDTRGRALGIFPAFNGMPIGLGFSVDTIESVGGPTVAYPSMSRRPDPDSPESKFLRGGS